MFPDERWRVQVWGQAAGRDGQGVVAGARPGWVIGGKLEEGQLGVRSWEWAGLVLAMTPPSLCPPLQE